MKKKLFSSLAFVLILFSSCNNKRDGEPRILVFSKTTNFRHSSIPKGIEAFQKLGKEHNFQVDTTENASRFVDDSLKKYAAIVFLNTTGNVLNARQEAAMERYIQAGGGFVGVHAATDTEYDWGWYTKLVGAQFVSHPAIQEADFIIKNKDFDATSFFEEDVWHREDELYNFKNINPDINVLIGIDESTYEGGTNGKNHPMSWYHDYDGGRAFYTELGHTDESYSEENYLKHLWGGLKYAMNDNKLLDYDKATTQLPPDADRFTKEELSMGEFFEPTEMTILPNLDILVAQRRGELMLYKQKTGTLSQVGMLDVYSETLNTPGVNAEEGVMGLQKDPNFKENHWIYTYYSPSGDDWTNRLSRFKFTDDKLQKDTEEVILEIETQREICCHTGGSIAFGPDGLLFLSTGDNSTPFNEKDVKFVSNGFAPLNDIPGHRQFDARRTAGNTNDLRGKIIRIKVNEDGTYDIPNGNLFPEGTEKTRPEIYTMGHRNPYRISVDQKNSNLYWGEVGPDAGEDSLKTRGPKGYDEVNQAKRAGNYGWPFVIANNKPYVDYDYATGKSGEHFDPDHLVNDSRNNTGLTNLPPAQKAMIWYPYDASPDFPEVGSGGRNAMAGPVYYPDMFPQETRLPDYYDSKLIIYEWIRGWMKAVTFDEEGNFSKMEPFAEDIELNNLIDMEVGPDGRIYLLEYGSGWFAQNDDSGLAVINYNGGNRPPLLTNMKVNKTSGSLPLSIKASVDARDRENDQITYLWDLGNGETMETNVPEVQYTYNKAGEYQVSVTAKDSQGDSTKNTVARVIAGNSRPEVKIAITQGNTSFYMPGVPLGYSVSVKDHEDGSNVDEQNIYVGVDYAEGLDKASMAMGHQEVNSAIMGKTLTQTLDCKSCHKVEEPSVGPSYMAVSERYKNDKNVYSYLERKIMAGGGGVWGEIMMPAHPNLSKKETQQIVDYIFSLTQEEQNNKSLPVDGTIYPEESGPQKSLVLVASYTDKGAKGINPLTETTQMIMPGNTFMVSDTLKSDGFTTMEYNGQKLLLTPKNAGWFALPKMDLTNVNKATINLGWQGEIIPVFNLEAHLDSPDGELLGKGSMITPGSGETQSTLKMDLKPVRDGNKHSIYFTYQPDTDQPDDVNSAVFSVKLQGDPNVESNMAQN
ncbi:ThuA domain-containing protein [Zunongwangia sp. F260]|uniref:ThuA domain-containing protein n=1 Tax=Autumnicola lenta TaxID=3075593 RepID=A0ABU3CG79_9FLAO|nr:ThuA domain-containing protein [Zunongwangia sp. F260]MDT0645354.1 ThuA domain-containing protein [Zunongwangia sp. F260]